MCAAAQPTIGRYAFVWCECVTLLQTDFFPFHIIAGCFFFFLFFHKPFKYFCGKHQNQCLKYSIHYNYSFILQLCKCIWPLSSSSASHFLSLALHALCAVAIGWSSCSSSAYTQCWQFSLRLMISSAARFGSHHYDAACWMKIDHPAYFSQLNSWELYRNYSYICILVVHSKWNQQ